MVDVIIILLQDLNRHIYILDITMRQMIFKLIVFECLNSKFSVKSCLYFHSTDLPNSVVWILYVRIDGFTRHFPCYGDVQLLWKVKMHSASKKVPYNFHTITSRS